MARPKTGSATLEQVTGGEQPPAEPTPTPPAAPARELPVLPDKKTDTGSTLEHKTVVLYGYAGVGKSTLASQWAGGGGLFFNCAGELGGLNVFQIPVQSWEDFRLGCAALAAQPGKYPCGIIDTSDILARYCADTMRTKMGVVHESDLEWGKGWDVLKGEWMLRLAKLSAFPNFGTVHVTHAQDIEMKTRTATWNKHTIRGSKGIRDTLLDMSDIVIYVDFDEEDETKRILRTKPSRYYDAKERGEKPRLPAEIEWPLGANGWDLIKAAWDAGQ